MVPHLTFAVLLAFTQSTTAFLNIQGHNFLPTRHVKAHSVSTDGPTVKEQLQSLLAGAPDNALVCPVSLEPLVKTTRFIGGADPQYTCSRFGTIYRPGPVYLDLVPKEAASTPIWERSLQEFVQTDFFRNPLIAFVYERGWRQGFANAGFPGIDKEFQLLQDFWGEDVLKGTLLDMSCGSGLMSRKLAEYGSAARLFAADYSEVMLLETRRRFSDESSLAMPELVRCDVARLPFATDALDGVHAGAALHCWPALEDGLREVCRSLTPGGKFFATTFQKGAYGVPSQVNDKGGPSFRFFERDELEGLLKDAGFTEVSVELTGQGCLIAKCIK
jgi:SAM-dependent methyltransferase